jgi:iron complex transport system substrate-binding protein
VNEALEVLGCRAVVVSLDPGTLDEVLDCVLQVGEATGSAVRATTLVTSLRERLHVLEGVVAADPRPRTFALEWSDPPFNGGHWLPEMIERAGGDPVLGSPGSPSVRVTWAQITEARPEVIVFMPCGYNVQSAGEEAKSFLERSEIADVDAVFAVDASAYFSRPGPRIVEGVELLAAALHPDSMGPPHPGRLLRVR